MGSTSMRNSSPCHQRWSFWSPWSCKDCTGTSCKKHKTPHRSWTSQPLRKIWLWVANLPWLSQYLDILAHVVVHSIHKAPYNEPKTPLGESQLPQPPFNWSLCHFLWGGCRWSWTWEFVLLAVLDDTRPNNLLAKFGKRLARLSIGNLWGVWLDGTYIWCSLVMIWWSCG
jgi:hypothetical protein